MQYVIAIDFSIHSLRSAWNFTSSGLCWIPEFLLSLIDCGFWDWLVSLLQLKWYIF